MWRVPAVLCMGAGFLCCTEPAITSSPASVMSTPDIRRSKLDRSTSSASNQPTSPTNSMRLSNSKRPPKPFNHSDLMSFQATHMGTTFEIQVRTTREDANVGAVVSEAFEAIAKVEELMSEWKPNSEISRVNRNAGRKATRVSEATMKVLSAALNIASKSKGAFDPTWAIFRDVWRFDQKPARRPERTDIERARALVDYRKLHLALDARTARLAREKMVIGLGAIAKGFAIDEAARILRQYGYENFIIDGGGDLYLGGRPSPTRKWSISIRHPRRTHESMGTIEVENAAVVTSGDYERYFSHGGERYHHIIDVRTGYPARGAVAITLVFPQAMTADALATAAFVLNSADTQKMFTHFPAAKWLIFRPDGSIEQNGTDNWVKLTRKTWKPYTSLDGGTPDDL